MKIIREHTVYFSEDEVRRMAGLDECWKIDEVNRSDEKDYEIKARFIYEIPVDEYEESPGGTDPD